MQRKNLAQRKVPPHHIIKYSIKKNDNWSCDSKYDKMDTWCYGNFSQFAYPDPFLKFVYFVCAIVPHVGIFTFFFDRYSNLEVLW